LEKALDAQRLTDTFCALQFVHGQVTMPRFSIQDGFDLKDTLSALGMGRAFDPVADFTGIAQPVQPLFIQFVRHDAVIIVDEKGTEASAVTGVGFGCAGQAMPRPIVIDRPFVYVIVDVPTGTVLFMGRFKGSEV
jgi:serpin B